MEYLPKGFTLEIPPGAFPLSTDSMALAHFVRLPKNARILDLGGGCGTLGLLLCARQERCQVTSVELDGTAHTAALDNIRRNGLASRMESICADLKNVPHCFPPGSFSCVVSNPPYFSGGAPSCTLETARQELHCTLADLMVSAAWALKFGGDFFLVHKPERLGQIIALAACQGLEAKRLHLLRHRQDGDIALILLQLRKGGKPGLTITESALYAPSGEPTPYYNEVYHL